jgi:hypothetical protein
MYKHIRGDRPFSLSDNFNRFDVAAWRASLCFLGIFAVGVANHVVQNVKHFRYQDKAGIVDDSSYRKVYDFFNDFLGERGDVDTDKASEVQRGSWRSVHGRLRLLYGDRIRRMREC